jgi:hypothetical protein
MNEFEIKVLEMLSNIDKELRDIKKAQEPGNVVLTVNKEAIAKSVGDGVQDAVNSCFPVQN